MRAKRCACFHNNRTGALGYSGNKNRNRPVYSKKLPWLLYILGEHVVCARGGVRVYATEGALLFWKVPYVLYAVCGHAVGALSGAHVYATNGKVHCSSANCCIYYILYILGEHAVSAGKLSACLHNE